MIKSNLIIFLFVLIYCSCSSNKLTDSEILKQIDLHRPLNEYVSLNDMSDCLGCTHVSGKYYMTDCPFIIEGAKQILALGYKNLKLWFEYPAKGYVFNSNWDKKTITSLKDLAGHPYYRACFDLPFKNISLCINELFPGNSTDNITCKMDTVEQNIYELAKYLLETYKNREITFIFQNWEGDWLLRGGTGEEAKWHINGPAADYKVRVDNMILWFKARQRGIDKARKEVMDSKCKVLHAIEVNRVMDGMNGVPSVATLILPEVQTDLVSWSAYDGVDDSGVKMFKGIDFLRKQMRPTEFMRGKKDVMIGEIGIPENVGGRTKEDVLKLWDTIMGVYISQKIPYIFIWQLYCNEFKNTQLGIKQLPVKDMDNLRGFWLIRPDGSKSWGQEYMDTLLN